MVLRTHQLQLTGDGAGPAFSTGEERLPFSGNAQQIASDVREYEGIGVGHLVVDLVRVSRDLDDMQRNMEQFCNQGLAAGLSGAPKAYSPAARLQACRNRY